MFLKVIRKNFLPFFLTILAFVLIYLVGKSVPEEYLRTIIKQAGPFGPIVLILFTLLTYVFAPLSGTPILFVGFYAFGQIVILYSFIAAFLASIINFWIARRWGRKIVGKMVGEETMQKVDKLAENYGLLSLFFLRVFEGIIHDIISYAAGLTSLSFPSYLIVSTLGMVPGTLLWYYFSLKTETPLDFTIVTLLFGYAMLILFVIWSLAIKRWRK